MTPICLQKPIPVTNDPRITRLLSISRPFKTADSCYIEKRHTKNEFELYFCIFNNRCVRYSRGSQDEERTGLIPVHLHIWYPWKAKPFKMRPNKKIRQNQKMKIQNTLNRFKIQFSDRKYFPKSGKRIHKHSNNASRVCNRLRLLTQNQVGFSK